MYPLEEFQKTLKLSFTMAKFDNNKFEFYEKKKPH